MAKKVQDADSSFVFATTHRLVVEGTRSYQELLEKLYDFGLKRVSNLPRAASDQQLCDAVAELIFRLMDATREVRSQHPDKGELECARDVLRRLRQADASARIHRKPGIRQRLKQQILKELGEAARSRQIEDPDRLPWDPKEQSSEETELGADPFSEEMLAEIRRELKQAWETICSDAFARVRKHSRIVNRRLAIIKALSDEAWKSSPAGLVADHFEVLVRQARPLDIINRLRADNTAPQRGRHAVSDRQLREDIRIVKDALGREIPSLRETERALRSRYAVEWAGRRLTTILRQAHAVQTEAASS